MILVAVLYPGVSYPDGHTLDPYVESAELCVGWRDALAAYRARKRRYAKDYVTWGSRMRPVQILCERVEPCTAHLLRVSAPILL